MEFSKKGYFVGIRLRLTGEIEKNSTKHRLTHKSNVVIHVICVGIKHKYALR